MRALFRCIKVFLALAIFLVALSPLGAGAAEKIGVLLLHGKAHGNKSIYHLSGELESAGFLVEMPSSTPWSPNRIYDRTYLETLKEMDAAVDKLKAAGATRVVVGGQHRRQRGALLRGQPQGPCRADRSGCWSFHQRQLHG